MKLTKLGPIVGALLLALGISQSASAIGGMFGMEFAIDAPWRLEPVRNSAGNLVYTPIPITIAFHDTIFEDNRERPASDVLPKIAVGRIIGIRVSEMGVNTPPVTQIRLRDIEEIEVKRALSTTSSEPPHQICRPSSEQDCGDLLEISNAHEWHGLFWYTPRTPLAPGSNLRLKVTVDTRAVELSAPPGGIPNPFAPPSSRFVAREWTNTLVVHAGEEPLPRFGADWLYGDVHYHSQSTDNEGESAYSYRNVVRALGASGFDFVFATDHASNSEQVIASVDGKTEARDLNRRRFGAAKAILYGPDGVNQLIGNEASRIGFPRLRSAGTLPQVYMGEELDAVPEMSPREFAAGNLRFGDLGLLGGKTYFWFWGQKNSSDNGCLNGSVDFAGCQARYARQVSNAKESYFHFDEQGIRIPVIGAPPGVADAGPYPSRHHIVYFPVDASLGPAGFIGSDTGPFGGARKRLQDIVREIEGGGFAFLAHPVEDFEPGGKEGPDVVPYSDLSLTRAWSSQAILGLQFWNENARHRAAPILDDRKSVVTVKTAGNTESFEYFMPFFDGSRWPSNPGVIEETFQRLHHGAATWDRYLRKGLDPRETARLRWLAKGEPRKWYAAGGSDAHGDWNYRRLGRVQDPRDCLRFCDYPVFDTAIANPRNLVAMRGQPSALPTATLANTPAGGPKRYSNREVIDAFRAGRFSVTDGPAIRIAVDKNRNGRIDDTDFPMGSTFTFLPGEHIPLLVEWFSTPEFGPIDQIDIYVGNSKETFAGKAHGAGLLPLRISQAPNEPLIEDFGGYTPDPSRALQIKLADTIGRFNRPNLPNSVGYHGVARIFIGPGQFRLANDNGQLSYVRAFARTITAQQGEASGQCPQVGVAGSKCGDRFALSNPIWAKYEAAICAANLPAASRPGSPPVPRRHQRRQDRRSGSWPRKCKGN